MKKTINGKTYDTETAKLLGGYTMNELDWFSYNRAILYKNNDEEFFLHRDTGPYGYCGRVMEDGSRAGGEDIFPISEEEAKIWASEAEYFSWAPGIYNEIFG